MKRRSIRHIASLLLILVSLGIAAYAQRVPTPGFNLFSKDQDIQIGQEGVKEIEKEVKLLNNPEVQRYVEGIGRRLVEAPEADQYPYTFKVVQDDSINAFALPGGPTYVHTGLILAADNEAQLAGVMGHEIAHVALRHGTNQASKANIMSLGAMLGGSLLGGGGSIGGQLAQLGIGFGLNSVLLKYSRNAERDADIVGARIMSRAGYNPIEAARFFEKLQAESGKRSGVEQFFSSHPNPDNRTARLEQEIQYFPQQSYDGDTGNLERIKAIIRGTKPPAAAQQPGQQQQQGSPQQGTAAKTDPIKASVQMQRHQDRGFAVLYPENWQLQTNNQDGSVTILPQDGLVAGQGGNSIARGIVSGIASIGNRQSVDLKSDTQTFIRSLQQNNPTLKLGNRDPRPVNVGGQTGLLTTLYSQSPFAGETELDMLLTVARPQGLYYMVFIAPQSEFRQHQPTFEKVLNSIQFR